MVTMRMTKILPLLLLPLIVTGCFQDEIEYAHTNPVDSIYDDGKFRIVLSQPNMAGSNSTIAWSALTYDGKEIEEDKVASFNGIELLTKAEAPNSADIDNVTSQQALTGWETASTLSEKAPYDGEVSITEATSQTSYVLEMEITYRYNEKDYVSQKVHSNIVTWTPE